MNYYGVGTKSVKQKDGSFETKQFRITSSVPGTRVVQVNDIEANAASQGIKLDGIYPMKNSADAGKPMSKGIQAQRAAAHAKQEAAFKKSLARKAR